MKKSLIRNFMLVSFLMVTSYTVFAIKADTISYWHVNFNDHTILKLNAHNEGFVFHVSADTLNEDDLLGIRYSTGCMICSDCKTHLAIFDQQKKLVQYEDGHGNWTPIYVSFRMILERYHETGETIFDCYYQQGAKADPEKAVHILRIQFE